MQSTIDANDFKQPSKSKSKTTKDNTNQTKLMAGREEPYDKKLPLRASMSMKTEYTIMLFHTAPIVNQHE